MRHTVLFLTFLVKFGHSYCLLESDLLVGSNSTGDVFSNLAELEALSTDNYTLKAFETCTDYQDNLVGMKYSVVSGQGNVTELRPIGKMSGTGVQCQTLEISGQIEKV